MLKALQNSIEHVSTLLSLSNLILYQDVPATSAEASVNDVFEPTEYYQRDFSAFYPSESNQQQQPGFAFPTTYRVVSHGQMQTVDPLMWLLVESQDQPKDIQILNMDKINSSQQHTAENYSSNTDGAKNGQKHQNIMALLGTENVNFLLGRFSFSCAQIQRQLMISDGNAQDSFSILTLVQESIFHLINSTRNFFCFNDLSLNLKLTIYKMIWSSFFILDAAFLARDMFDNNKKPSSLELFLSQNPLLVDSLRVI